ncbi:hypothetical protein KIN20_006962 [Parelaphostrongylus tenuis]|uniref:Uncharacterized protein n=1 Tax=Parelaphostrongylus tenuis TaxID=148309 RepID=A0AAD5QLI2_PARTN|nr:hypothetical protein KIN20_006962 [Parelaphostrongylus tenuis]
MPNDNTKQTRKCAVLTNRPSGSCSFPPTVLLQRKSIRFLIAYMNNDCAEINEACLQTMRSNYESKKINTSQ